MPRDLTDLMERATSVAPPEPHAAAEITRLAIRTAATPYDEHRRRGLGRGDRRRLAGYGASRGQNEHSRAGWATTGTTRRSTCRRPCRPAASLATPGAVDDPVGAALLGRLSPLPTYQGVDAAGRLLVIDCAGRHPATRPVPGRASSTTPGGAAQPLQAPASPGSVRIRADQLAAGVLRRRPAALARDDGSLRLEERVPHHRPAGWPRRVRAGHVPRRQVTAIVADPGDVTGRVDRGWRCRCRYCSKSRRHRLRRLPRDVLRPWSTKVGTGVSVASMSGAGRAGWVDHARPGVRTVGLWWAARAGPGASRPGLPRAARPAVQSAVQFAVTGSAIALTEYCGSGSNADRAAARVRPVGATARAGHRALRRSTCRSPVTSCSSRRTRMTCSATTSSPAPCPGSTPRRRVAISSRRSGAGSYVLWYDTHGRARREDPRLADAGQTRSAWTSSAPRSTTTCSPTPSPPTRCCATSPSRPIATWPAQSGMQITHDEGELLTMLVRLTGARQASRSARSPATPRSASPAACPPTVTCCAAT